jgi:alpha-D-xyloside xylohydrolase
MTTAAAEPSPALDRPIAGGRLRVDVITESIFRIRFTLDESFGDRPSFMVLPQLPGSAQWTSEQDNTTITIRTDRLQLRIDRATGAFTWLDAAGGLLVREPARGGKHLERVPVERRIFDRDVQIRTETTADGVKTRVEGGRVIIDRQAFQTKLEFVFSDDEAIYGLGQHEEGILNYRGKHQYLYQQNMKVAMPVIVSTRGWAILFDTASLATFHDDEHGSYFWTDVDEEMDFYFIIGPEFDQIIAALRRLTGRPTMLPRWAYGYIQSKERYRTQQELVDTVAEFRRRLIPIDCIVQDWLSWTGKWWGNKDPDPERFPDPSAAAKQLHEMNARLMVSIWPIMRGECPNQVEMRQAGFLLGNDATYDAFNPRARDLYWDQANRGWFRHGIDAWWCDCTEPFDADWKGAMKPQPWKRLLINTGEAKKYLDPEQINAYSMVHSQGIYENQRITDGSKRVVNLTRSGFPGQQRYGAITWSGDTAATWQTLRRQIADGLNFCITGNPRWTIDIGAFFVGQKEQWFWRGDFPGGCEDEGYRELYVRWLQFGTFLPMFRSHGTDTPREPWRFGEPSPDDTPASPSPSTLGEGRGGGPPHTLDNAPPPKPSPGEPGEGYHATLPAYSTLLKYIHFRYQLLPYIYSLTAAETLHDYTMLRMLAFDFRHDPAVFDIRDQFMFGPALLICPVTEPMYFGPGSARLVDIPKQRRVYLPAGCDWYDFWTNRRYEGGQTITADAPLDIIPIFVRAGSILPIGPVVQHSGEKLNEPIELRIYSGRDAKFTFYEDEGDGYGYEQGQFATVELQWSDAGRALTVHPRQGSFPGMPPRRLFEARLIDAQPGADATLSPPQHLSCGSEGITINWNRASG